MDTLFTFLKKGLVATLFVVFGFTVTYVPQAPTSNVPVAEAGGLGGISTSVGQMIQNGSALVGNATATITAGNTANSFFVNNVLDGLAWGLAKSVISNIMQETINWVNRGFEGQPAFVQDLRGFLIDIADAELGRMLDEITGTDSFICSPFRLDVKLSLELQFQQGKDQRTAPKCTLTGIINNIEGFIAGVDTGNGLADWITITSAPEVYTPYGAALNAKANLRARIINSQGEERTILGFGNGFQSQKFCRPLSGVTGSENCAIVKPGQVIAEQLNQALGAGTDTLIEADEINELFSALLAQVGQRALQGTAGLLGLSGDDAFGDRTAGPSYLDRAISEQDSTFVASRGASQAITNSLRDEIEFGNEARRIRQSFVTSISQATTEEAINLAARVSEEINTTIVQTENNITRLQSLESNYEQAATDDVRVDLLLQFSTLNLTEPAEAASIIDDWNNAARSLGIEL